MNKKFRLACLPKHGTDRESWTFFDQAHEGGCMRENAMFKIAGTLPVKTRLPFAAWVIAGLVTIYSLMASLVTSDVQSCRASKHFCTRDPLRICHKSAQSTVGPLKCGVPHAAFL